MSPLSPPPNPTGNSGRPSVILDILIIIIFGISSLMLTIGGTNYELHW